MADRLESDANQDASIPRTTMNRFPRAAVKVLRDWLEAHADSPYPSDCQKVELEDKTGLSSAQIATWFANARRRSNYGKGHKRSQSHSIPMARNVIATNVTSTATPWHEVSIPTSFAHCHMHLTFYSSIPWRDGSTRHRRTSPHRFMPSRTPWPGKTFKEAPRPLQRLDEERMPPAVSVTRYTKRSR